MLIISLDLFINDGDNEYFNNLFYEAIISFQEMNYKRDVHIGTTSLYYTLTPLPEYPAENVFLLTDHLSNFKKYNRWVV
jgi:hypothetical protein